MILILDFQALNVIYFFINSFIFFIIIPTFILLKMVLKLPGTLSCYQLSIIESVFQGKIY